MLVAPRPSARLGGALLLLALAAAPSACGGTGVTTGDEQDIVAGVPATAWPEAVIVNALTSDAPTASCSGVLIAPRAVLTAGHCVDGFHGWGVLAPNAGEQWAMSYEAEVLDWTSGMTFTFEQHDVAIVHLPSDITLDAYPVVGADPVADGTEVVTVGRVKDGWVSEDQMWESAPFAVYQDLGIPGKSHPYHYGSPIQVIQKGDSGGPAFLPGATPHEVVALNSSYHFLARLDLVRDWIAERLEAHAPTP